LPSGHPSAPTSSKPANNLLPIHLGKYSPKGYLVLARVVVGRVVGGNSTQHIANNRSKKTENWRNLLACEAGRNQYKRSNNYNYYNQSPNERIMLFVPK
jgi:hypothetical protein